MDILKKYKNDYLLPATVIRVSQLMSQPLPSIEFEWCNIVIKEVRFGNILQLHLSPMCQIYCHMEHAGDISGILGESAGEGGRIYSAWIYL